MNATTKDMQEKTGPMLTRIRLIHTDTLSCEPILRRMPDGNLLCVSQCGDVTEPAPGNRVYAFISRDNGDTWEARIQLYPETGEAVYCTEVMVLDSTISAFLEIHSGRFLNMRCEMIQSNDSGKTWTRAGASPGYPDFCFHRGMIPLPNGEIILACQRFPVSQEENARLVVASHNIVNPRQQRGVMHAGIDHLCNDVIISADRGKTFQLFAGPAIPIKGATGRNWAWTEPTLTPLSDGRLVMYLRVDGSGCLWRSESRDMGRTWTEAAKTDIPNPGNKPKLIPMPDGRIALIHTPNPVPGSSKRYPLSLWISDDDLATFRDKRVVTDFPGRYCYPDGFFEDGHILFTIEINRHDILFFDCEV